MVYWFRQVGLVLVFIFTIHLFPGIRHTPERLSGFYERQWPRRDALLLEWRTEHAGETVLAPTVQTMIALLRENQVTAFRYSDAVARDPDASVKQRLAEAPYPIRLEADAKHLLMLASEGFGNCEPVAARQEVILARCP